MEADELLSARVVLLVAVDDARDSDLRSGVASDGREGRLGEGANEDQLAAQAARDQNPPRPLADKAQREVVDMALDALALGEHLQSVANGDMQRPSVTLGGNR